MDPIKQPAHLHFVSNYYGSRAENICISNFAEILKMFPIMTLQNVKSIIRNYRETGRDIIFYGYIIRVGSYSIEPDSKIVSHYADMLKLYKDWVPTHLQDMLAEFFLLKTAFHTIEGSIKEANQYLREAAKAINNLQQGDNPNLAYVEMLIWGYVSLAKYYPSLRFILYFTD